MVVAVLVGPPPPVQGLNAEAVLRGFGAPVLKSAVLLFVSTQPLPFRSTAVVFDGAAVGLPPSELFAVPKPTKSTTPAVPAQVAPQLKAVVLLTSATLPAVALMLVLPVWSGVGKAAA